MSRPPPSPLAALLLATCAPPEPPEWLIHEPTFLGIQTAVVQDGPHAEGLQVYPGHERVQPLPLDTLEWRWLGAAPPGTTIPPPIWIHCDHLDTCIEGMTGLELRACPDPLPLAYTSTCRLGVGHRLTARLSDLDSGVWRGLSVLVVTSAELDPEECLARLRSSPRPDLTRCVIATGYVIRLRAPSDLPDDFPEELRDEPANTNPTLSLVVRREDGDIVSAVDGDTVTVRAGEPLEVEVRPGVDAAQTYWQLFDDDFTLRVEELRVETYVDRADVDYTQIAVGRLQLTAPDDPAPVTLHVRMSDDRGGLGVATLRFLAIRGPS